MDTNRVEISISNLVYGLRIQLARIVRANELPFEQFVNSRDKTVAQLRVKPGECAALGLLGVSNLACSFYPGANAALLSATISGLKHEQDVSVIADHIVKSLNDKLPGSNARPAQPSFIGSIMRARQAGLASKLFGWPLVKFCLHHSIKMPLQFSPEISGLIELDSSKPLTKEGRQLLTRYVQHLKRLKDNQEVTFRTKEKKGGAKTKTTKSK
jgi:hypothetical protein